MVAVVALRRPRPAQGRNSLTLPPNLKSFAPLHAALLVAARRVPPFINHENNPV
jgi:hypothetical protein